VTVKGWQGPTKERLALAERVRVLRDDDGLPFAEIAKRLRLSRSYTNALYHDPTGRDQRALKDTHAGTCVECGERTSGSNGRQGAPEYCERCSRAASKRWTRDTVIDAIQRFARDHGRAPTSGEWIGADTDRGYPPRTSVYRSTSTSTAPFKTWADAIEAAGFARPWFGRRTHQEVFGMQERTGYVVLREVSADAWELIAERAETTQIAALNAALDGSEPSGRWVAVPRRFWHPRTLQPRTIYDWAEPSEAEQPA
jgi:Homing endonuclease associated repeat